MRGLISDEELKRIHNLFSRAGLSMDHPDFNEEILDQGTKAILKVRNKYSPEGTSSNFHRLAMANSVLRFPLPSARASS